jgi:hypothetical protein
MGILTSSNYGKTWSSPGSGLTGIWYTVETSSTGQYVLGIHNSACNLSKDYGSNYKGVVTSVQSGSIS